MFSHLLKNKKDDTATKDPFHPLAGAFPLSLQLDRPVVIGWNSLTFF